MPEKTLSEVFGDIADAIREKTDSQETMTPLEMADEISSILKPSGTITISEAGNYDVAEYAEADVEVAGFEPENSGWYYYDTDSKWYDQPSIPANTLVYATGLGDECVYPELGDGYSYIYSGEGQFEIMNGVYAIDNGDYTTLYDGLYYLNDISAYEISLNAGSTYIYNGDSSFIPVEAPTEDGVYLRDDGEWSQVNSGLYFISSTEGGSIWDAAVDGTPIYGQSGYYYYNADSSYFNYLMIDGSHADDLSSDALLWVDPDSSKELKTISLNKGDVYTYEGGSVFEPYEPDFNTILADYITEEYGYDLRDAQYVPWLYTAGSGISPVNKGTWVVGHDDVLYDYDFANNKLYWVGNVGDHESAQEDITELQLNSGSTYTYNGDGDFELFTPESPAQENGLYYGNDDGSYTAFSGCLYEGTGLYQLNYDTSARRIVLDAVGDSQVVELNEEHYKVIRID